MDNKQQHIFRNILDHNSLPHENVFIQHRNLKEFKSFFIERINPNHRIELYGRLKRSKVKDHNFSKSIKVGEILLCMGFYVILEPSMISTAVNLLMGIILFEIVLELVTVDVNRNRGKHRIRENPLHGSLFKA